MENFSAAKVEINQLQKINGGKDTAGGSSNPMSGKSYSCDWEDGCDIFYYNDDGSIDRNHCV